MSVAPRGTVIVGGGLAGVMTAVHLRSSGYDDPVTIIGDEPELPYHRPPLSKHRPRDGGRGPDPLRPAAFYRDHEIEVVRGCPATRLDPAGRTIELADGDTVTWQFAVLATGARPRHLAGIPSRLDGVHTLRTAADARLLWSESLDGASVVVVGGGFVGLEFAAAATREGANVTVVETEPQLLGRAVSPTTADAIARYHLCLGVELLPGERVARVEHSRGRVVAAELASGRRLPADLLLVAVGAEPRVELARTAALTVDDGIVVDDRMRTSAPGVFAIGDCARWRDAAGVMRRLESVQNATDQGAHVAHVLTGSDRPFVSTPWFWSDQADLRLQIAGIASPRDATTTIPGTSPFELTVLRHDRGRLTCVETIGRPSDHMAGRRLIGHHVDIGAVEQGSSTLKEQVRSRLAH